MTAETMHPAGARLVWPTLAAIAGLAVLLALGFWQLERLEWKERLLTQIRERATAAPVSVEISEERFAAGAAEYLRIAARGRFLHDREVHLFAPDPALGPGFHVYTPLMLDDGRAIIVNRGYVPERLKARDQREDGLTSGTVTVRGLVRAPSRAGVFTPGNNPGTNIWFWRDLDGMVAAMFGAEQPARLPFFIDAETELGASLSQPWPRGGATRLSLTNRHLEYALTWFGLAASLAAVYAAFAAGRLRRRDP